MPILNGAIDPDGALVNVQIGWSAAGMRALRKSYSPVPQPVDKRALLDTGAEATFVHPSIPQALRLLFRGPAPVNAPATGGFTLVPRYDVSLTILHPSGNARDNLTISDLVVMEYSSLPPTYDTVTGRDVLAKCEFVYSGRLNTFSLSY